MAGQDDEGDVASREIWHKEGSTRWKAASGVEACGGGALSAFHAIVLICLTHDLYPTLGVGNGPPGVVALLSLMSRFIVCCPWLAFRSL